MILSIFSIPLLADNLILPISILLVIAILFTKVGTRFGVPVMLIFLLLGMLAGPDGIGLSVKNLHLAEFLGHLAMTIILLTGGLETSLEETRPVQKPAIVLSSLGVLITIVALGFFSFYVLDPHWMYPAGCGAFFDRFRQHFLHSPKPPSAVAGESGTDAGVRIR